MSGKCDSRKILLSTGAAVEKINAGLLALQGRDVQIRRNGIEFHSLLPLELWTELKVRIEFCASTDPIEFRAVVVDCRPCGGTTYRVSLMTFELSSEARHRLQNEAGQ